MIPIYLCKILNSQWLEFVLTQLINYNSGSRYAIKIICKEEMGLGGILLQIYSPEYLEQFINLRIPRKQWTLVHHLSKYTTHRPDINRGRVMAGTQQYFWCSVPERHHLERTTKTFLTLRLKMNFPLMLNIQNSHYLICCTCGNS